jgi:hypothetical protein
MQCRLAVRDLGFDALSTRVAEGVPERFACDEQCFFARNRV